jgi:integrase/recombinase XerD
MWLRVSELVALKISDLFFKRSLLWSREKEISNVSVPISVLTQKYINSYRNGIRLHIAIKKGFEDTLFLNRRGAQLSRAMILQL